MNSQEKDAKNLMKEALDQIQVESLTGDEANQSSERVWAAIEQEAARAASPAAIGRIEGCADFRALMPDYLSGQLPPARRTLLEDHLRECVECRRVFWMKQAPAAHQAKRLVLPTSRPIVKWAIAACLIVAFGVVQYVVLERFVFTDTSFHAVADQVEGKLLLVEGATMKAVEPGQRITLEQVIRTGRDSDAVLRLKDGSLVEMKERSELSLDASSKGPMIRLHRGSVIVQAAKQQEGNRLAVDTSDCRVTVKGTVFAVTRSTKGARVSVIEGQVWVEQGKQTRTLKPGEQFSTNVALQPVTVEQEIAWSRNVDRHIALLREFVTLGQDLMEGMASTELRYNSRLLPLVGEDAVFYAAFPNLSTTFGPAYDSFQKRIAEDPQLAEWWQETNRSEDGGLTVEETLTRVRRLGNFLGEELVVAVTDKTEGGGSVLLLADVKDQAGLRAELEDDVSRFNGTGHGEVARFVDDPAQLAPGTDEKGLLIYIGPGFLAISPSPEEIQRVAVAQAAGGGLPSTGFAERLRQVYAEGAGWVFAADMGHLINKGTVPEDDGVGEKLGFSDLSQLVVEQKSIAGQLQSRAVLSFSKPRHGMSGWLGDAGPMGTLDFVSPDAFAVGCFLLKDPALIVDEIFQILQASEGSAWQDILDFQSEQGVDIREDVAVPLGSEFLLAVDGPLLPKPAWKVVIEVDDPARLEQTIQQMVDSMNVSARQEGKTGVTLTQESTGSLNYFKLTSESGPDITYAFWDGYLIMTPGQGLLTQAIQYRDTGYTLGRAPAFKALFPVETSDECSGLLYQNFMPLVSSLAEYVPDQAAGLTEDQVASLREAAAKTPATLIVVTGGTNEIVFSGRGLPGLNLLSMAAFGDIGKMIEMNPQAMTQ